MMLGRVLVTVLSAVLVVGGLALANTCPPLSGGHGAGVVLVAAGGFLFCRMVYVARRVDVA